MFTIHDRLTQMRYPVNSVRGITSQTAQHIDHFWQFHDRNVPPNRAELSVKEVLPLTTIVELDTNRAPDHYDKGCLVELTDTLIT